MASLTVKFKQTSYSCRWRMSLKSLTSSERTEIPSLYEPIYPKHSSNHVVILWRAVQKTSSRLLRIKNVEIFPKIRYGYSKKESSFLCVPNKLFWCFLRGTMVDAPGAGYLLLRSNTNLTTILFRVYYFMFVHKDQKTEPVQEPRGREESWKWSKQASSEHTTGALCTSTVNIHNITMSVK